MEIQLPHQIQSQQLEENRSMFTISPCYPGYGTTLGNALRRVLLSSLPGAAITAVRIKGVDHEFSTIEHVKEDVVDILLNLKKVRLKVYSDEAVQITLTVNGKKKVSAKDFGKNSDVEVISTDCHIATLTDAAAKMEITAIVQKGRGYIPVEARENEKLDVGFMALDAVYTPVRNVNFKMEHVRVEQMTNYDKLLLDVTTDGTLSPEDAVKQASSILVDHFALIGNSFSEVSEA
ncbi:MAG: DNA-directed RNA polymerase subunit alpha [uncultured bacterium]|nr:MAG: DNA-directed RNA polymerase subunit alpha [uncultured bacterium]